MSTTETIQIIAILVNIFVSIATITIAISTLKESTRVALDSKRAYISFFIIENRSRLTKTLVIKNFGNSGGKLLNITLDPPLDYSKSKPSIRIKCITEFTNIYLAPSQSIKSEFIFKDYPDKKFNVTVEYETCNNIYKESYELDIEYLDVIVTNCPSPTSEIDALRKINSSIQEVSDKLL